jgi:hypothetical protein
MIADINTMSRMFKECNEKYFDGSLPKPGFQLINKLNTLARFVYNKDKKGKHPIKWQVVKFTDCYDFPEEDFREIMVHELIHYYIAWNGIKDNKDHGREFMRIANEINEKYGLNVTKTKDASSFKRTENAPDFTGFFQFLWG